MDFPAIVTERLFLRDFRESDIPAVFEIFSDDRVTEFYDIFTMTDISQAEKTVQNILRFNARDHERALRWAIALRDDPSTVIGSCGYHTTNKHFRSIEIGYELHPRQWGRGYACEAVSAMIAFCFDNNFPFPLNRIAAATNLDSTRSISLLKRLGFTEEGILREWGYWKNAFQDVRMFSLLRRDYPLRSL
jgi:ribosomal-protein-alanine N-acetyltransferase